MWQDQIPDQSGRIVLLTGGTSGLGLYIARVFYQKNAHVIITARSHLKGVKAVDLIKTHCPGSSGSIEFGILELKELRSVHQFAQWFLEKESPLHVLLLNAGIAAVPYEPIHGIESQFFVNYLAHYLLVKLLLEKIKASAPARIIFVSSIAHKIVTDFPIRWETLARKRYDGMIGAFEQYGVAKLAVICYANLLADRLREQPVYVNTARPGPCRTHIVTKIPIFFTWKGARSELYPAVHPIIQAKNIRGGYFAPVGKLREPSGLTKDRRIQEDLETISDELIKHVSEMELIK